MASVPQRTLDWLYRVLISNRDSGQGYRDPNRTYNDIAFLLSVFPNFTPRTDVYTYENGASALLLNLSGTLPVPFRGVEYRFPITVWVPTGYPREPPIVYVNPTQDMVVRPGQHVSGEGRIYHHYLAHWAEASNRSTVVDFLHILRDVFAKEPPVTSKQAQSAQMATSIPHQFDTGPPPVPPLPTQIARLDPQPRPTPHLGDIPPQLPPKPGKLVEQHAQGGSSLHREPAPLPPLPSEFQGPKRHSFKPPPIPPQTAPPQNTVHPAHRPSPLTTSIQLPPVYTPSYNYSQESRSPISPISQTGTSPVLPSSTPQAPQPPRYAQPVPVQPVRIQPRFMAQPPPQPALRSHGMQSQQEPPRKQPPADLLTSPFELELPRQTPIGPPPPIPPNPEKDFLLKTLSSTLTKTLHDNIDKTKSALQPLDSQSYALHAAIANLKSEIAALNNYHATLQSNTSILKQSLHRADGIIADARARMTSTAAGATGPSADRRIRSPTGLPPVDEILVPPTVVGKQIYDLVADERGIERALYALQTALTQGRVSLETWARLTRSLARESFIKKALIKKASKGMGLDVVPLS